eukprot:GFYU01016358.1.p1 GENE.GFYU01016358.1~~GFYU01016358.1.p1  ORF type:complete len:405 (-),score=115.47 GFYU01016358.1:154-1368(-)
MTDTAPAMAIVPTAPQDADDGDIPVPSNNEAVITVAAANIKTHTSEKKMFALFVSQGDIFIKQGDYGKACNSYSKALELDGNNPAVLCRRSIAFYHMNLFESALVDAELSLEDGNDNAEAQFCKAEALFRLDELDVALEWYEKASGNDVFNERYKTGVLKCQMALQRARKSGAVKQPNLEPTKAPKNSVQRLFSDRRMAELLKDIDLTNDFVLDNADADDMEILGIDPLAEEAETLDQWDEEHEERAKRYMGKEINLKIPTFSPGPPRAPRASSAASSGRGRRPNTTTVSKNSSKSVTTPNRPRTVQPRPPSAPRSEASATPRKPIVVQKRGPGFAAPPSSEGRGAKIPGFRSQVKRTMKPAIDRVYWSHDTVIASSEDMRLSKKKANKYVIDTTKFELQGERD